MLSQLHNVIANSSLREIIKNNFFDVSIIIQEGFEQIKASSKENDAFSNHYTDKAGELVNLVRELKYPDLPFFPIHRDISSENVIFDKDKLIGVIDFDNVSVYNEPLVKDIANLFLYSCFNKNKREELNFRLAKSFFKMYSRTRKLSREEIIAIPILAVMGCLEDLNYEYWLYKNESSPH